MTKIIQNIDPDNVGHDHLRIQIMVHILTESTLHASKSIRNIVYNVSDWSVVDQWVHLTDERNAVIAPTPGSGVPGIDLLITR